MKNIIGRKVGMTSVFTADGRYVPVTVIEAGPCSVVQRKTKETDGYEAVAPVEQLAHDHEGLEMVKSRPYTS